MPAGAQERLAPEFLGVEVYRGGQTAQQSWPHYMKLHGIEDHPAAQEGMVAAVAIDSLLLVDGYDIVKSTAVETLARELYGPKMAVDICKKKEDWQLPKGAAKDWTSRVRWELRDRFSIRKLLQGGHRVQKAEAEVKKGMEQDALFAKYLGKVAPSSTTADKPADDG